VIVTTTGTAITELGGNFDLIIDDADHVPAHQISAALTLLPFLAPGGTYVIEDVTDIAAISTALSSRAIPHQILVFKPNPSNDNRLVVIPRPESE
jgi:hypothetical protein